MSDNITKLPAKDEPCEMMIMCECGCTTMYVLTTGFLLCSRCGERFEDDLTAYKVENIKEVSNPGGIKEVHNDGTVDLAFRRTLGQAAPGETVFLAVINKDEIHSWGQLDDISGAKDAFLDSVDRFIERTGKDAEEGD